jgi:hypothetical protein
MRENFAPSSDEITKFRVPMFCKRLPELHTKLKRGTPSFLVFSPLY